VLYNIIYIEMSTKSIYTLSLSNDNYEIDKLEKNKSYRYQYKKDKYCNLEQIVNFISHYHINHNTDTIKPEPIIEFSIIGSSNIFTNIYDKSYYNKNNIKLYPEFSIIINFDDNECQLILTNVDNDAYKFKEFDTQTDITLITLTKYQNITFNSRLYHGYNNLLNKDCSVLSQKCLLINIWNTIETDIPYFLPDNNYNYNNITINNDKFSYTYTTNQYNDNVTDFFDNLLYQQICHFKPDNKINTPLYKITFNDKNGIVEKEINQTISFNDPIWNNTFISYNMFPEWMCQWFIKEFDNIRQEKQNVLIDNIKNIHSIFTCFFPHMFQTVIYFYSIPKCHLHIYDGNISKLNDKSIVNTPCNDTTSNKLIMIICLKTSNLNNGYISINSNKYNLKTGCMLAVHCKHDISFHNVNNDDICIIIHTKIN